MFNYTIFITLHTILITFSAPYYADLHMHINISKKCKTSDFKKS